MTNDITELARRLRTGGLGYGIGVADLTQEAAMTLEDQAAIIVLKDAEIAFLEKQTARQEQVIDNLIEEVGRLRKAVEPVIDWFQSDEGHTRPTEDIIKDIVSDLQMDRKENLAMRKETTRLREALEWYGEQAWLCRLIHSEGDKGRQALAADGGKGAREALKGSE